MTQIAIGERLYQQLLALTQLGVEQGAAVFLRYDSAGDRYLVQDIEIARDGDCLGATETEITFAPQFLVRVTRLARLEDLHLGLLHTHPNGATEFSAIDDATELRLVDYLNARNPVRHSFSLMMCGSVIRARKVASGVLMPVRKVGATVETYHPPGVAAADEDERFDRQVRAFGEAGQATLSQLKVAIVGLGGTGSLVVQQMAHLGVRNFQLVDDDLIDKSNLNRVVGANADKVDRAKVDVAEALIHSVQPEATVIRLAMSVISEEARQALCTADCIFLCTDSHSSRAFVNELSYQYLVPAFDMGVSISAQEGRVAAVTGRVQMLAPGLPCLWCAGVLNPRIIREELMSEEARKADPYFQGQDGGVKQPAVISINSTVASLAVTMMLGAFTNIPATARWQSYNALAGTVRLMATQPSDECGVCGASGVIGAADSRALLLLQKNP